MKNMSAADLQDFHEKVLAEPKMLLTFAPSMNPYHIVKGLQNVHVKMMHDKNGKKTGKTPLHVIAKLKPTEDDKELWVAILCAFVEKGKPFSTLPSELQTVETLTAFNNLYYKYWYKSNTLGERIASGAYLDLTPELRARNDFRQFILLHNENFKESYLKATGDEEEDAYNLDYIQKTFSLSDAELEGFKESPERLLYLLNLFGIDYEKILEDTDNKKVDFTILHYKSNERMEFSFENTRRYGDSMIM